MNINPSDWAKRQLQFRSCYVYFDDKGVVLTPAGPLDPKKPNWSWRRPILPYLRLPGDPSAQELGLAVQRALTCEPIAPSATTGPGSVEAALKAVGYHGLTLLERSSRSFTVEDYVDRVEIRGRSNEPHAATKTEACSFAPEAIGQTLFSLLPSCPKPDPLVPPRPGKSYSQPRPSPRMDGGVPQTFGYKRSWIVVDSTDAEAVALALGLKELREQTWDLDPYAPDGVFVSPSVLGWTFILGHHVGWSGSPGPDTEISHLLCDLSRRFGEAQYFTNHRVVSLAGWARAVDGQIVRAYVNADDVMWDEGDLTDEERELGFENFVRFDTKLEDLGDLDLASERDVMTLAGRWSINPQELDAYESEGPGFLGDLD